MVFKFYQRLGGRAYTLIRRIVWCVSVLVMLAFMLAVYLNVHGIPQAVLRSLVDHLNKSGIPLDVERVNLTFHGWRAEKLRYYSGNPDDLHPLLVAEEVFIKRGIGGIDRRAKSYSLQLKAHDITVSPSVEWCVGLPRPNIFQHVDSMALSVDNSPDGIVIRDGSIVKGNVLVKVDGTIHAKKGLRKSKTAPFIAKRVEPLLIKPEWYAWLENELKAFDSSGGVVVDIDYSVDMQNLPASRCTLSVRSGDFTYHDVAFSHGEISASYDHNALRLERVVLQKDNGTLEINGNYAVGSRQAELRVANNISSKRMYLLFPEEWLELLSKVGMRADFFPSMNLRFGPALPKQLLQQVDGSFSINKIGCWDLEISSLAGKIQRIGSRLAISQTKGVVYGQVSSSDEIKSSLQGGPFNGEVFWDSEAHEFGVSAKTGFDPNLLLMPLSFCSIATNVISRFGFEEPPPQIQLELGACYDDWQSFYLKISGSASDMRFHDASFSSVNVSSSYFDTVLTLDSFVAKQDLDFIKGSASLDFRNGVAGFDVAGHMNPKTIEDLIYPGYGIFTKNVKVSGPCKISGQGSVDWRQMRETSFSGRIEAQRVNLPMVAFDNFSAKVSGDGPSLRIANATFNAYGGSGVGIMSILMDPAQKGIPYKADVRVKNADFNKGLRYLYPENPHNATGDLIGSIQFDADFSQPFFRSANGKGHIEIRHGQLADLPLFRGFSNMMRMLIPSFRIFSINRLAGDFELKNGVIYSENAYFEGDLLSAKGRGSYSKDEGFDAYVQTQVFRDNNISRVFRFLTDPFLKLLEVKLEGTINDPVWKLDTFSFGAKSGATEE